MGNTVYLYLYRFLIYRYYLHTPVFLLLITHIMSTFVKKVIRYYQSNMRYYADMF